MEHTAPLRVGTQKIPHRFSTLACQLRLDFFNKSYAKSQWSHPCSVRGFICTVLWRRSDRAMHRMAVNSASSSITVMYAWELRLIHVLTHAAAWSVYHQSKTVQQSIVSSWSKCKPLSEYWKCCSLGFRHWWTRRSASLSCCTLEPNSVVLTSLITSRLNDC